VSPRMETTIGRAYVILYFFKTPRLTESTCLLWRVNLTKKSSRLWGRIHKSKIHITTHKCGSLTLRKFR
jgi:hypothetical protein